MSAPTRKIVWRAFGDDRLEGAAFGWTYYGRGGVERLSPYGNRDARKDPLGDGPKHVRLSRIGGGRPWRGEFYVGNRTVALEFPARIGESGYGEAREAAKRKLEEVFWAAYDAWHNPKAKAEREDVKEQIEFERAEATKKAEARGRCEKAAPDLAKALASLVSEARAGRVPEEDLIVLAEVALRDAGIIAKATGGGS